jgi:hypothetical protein
MPKKNPPPQPVDLPLSRDFKFFKVDEGFGRHAAAEMQQRVEALNAATASVVAAIVETSRSYGIVMVASSGRIFTKHAIAQGVDVMFCFGAIYPETRCRSSLVRNRSYKMCIDVLCVQTECVMEIQPSVGMPKALQNISPANKRRSITQINTTARLEYADAADLYYIVFSTCRDVAAGEELCPP